MTTLTDLETLLPGLHASAPQPLQFDRSMHIRAFLLERAAGNILLYAAPGFDPAAAAAYGGIARHYLNHWHEAIFAGGGAGAPVFVHRDDRAEAAARLPVRAAFSRRHHLDEDFEVIPIPGHTPGATAYLWDSGGHRLLFTGDTLLLSDGEWTGAVLATSDRARYLESLSLLRELDFDVLVPWAATAGQAPLAHTDPADARRRIDALIARLWDGASH